MAYSNLHPSYYHPITNPVPDPSPYYPSHTPPFYSTTTPPTFIHTLQQQTCVSPNSFYHQHPPQNQISNHFPWVSHPPFNISHTTTPQQPSSSPSPSPNPYISSPSPQTLPPSRLETKLSNFDGSEDAYWWIICSEKSFNNRNQRLSDAEKIIESILALRGAALTWWFSWFPTHRRPSWDSFTCGLLQQFKPEWGLILPGEEEDSIEEAKTEFIASVKEKEEPIEDEEPVATITLQGTPQVSEMPENTEFIVEEAKPTVAEPKMLVDGRDFFSMTNQNFETVEKGKESKTHHDSLSISLCPKSPPTPQFLSTVSSPALLSPPQGPVPLVEPPSKQLLKSLETNISPASKPPSKL
ncbi:swarming motility protein ybiA, partial [Trifolium pratense]